MQAKWLALRPLCLLAPPAIPAADNLAVALRGGAELYGTEMMAVQWDVVHSLGGGDDDLPVPWH